MTVFCLEKSQGVTLCLQNTLLILDNIHLNCLIICTCMQMASFATAALSDPLWGKLQNQLLSASSLGTNPLCHGAVQYLSLPRKAEIVVNSCLRP